MNHVISHRIFRLYVTPNFSCQLLTKTIRSINSKDYIYIHFFYTTYVNLSNLSTRFVRLKESKKGNKSMNFQTLIYLQKRIHKQTLNFSLYVFDKVFPKILEYSLQAIGNLHSPEIIPKCFPLPQHQGIPSRHPRKEEKKTETIDSIYLS